MSSRYRRFCTAITRNWSCGHKAQSQFRMASYHRCNGNISGSPSSPKTPRFGGARGRRPRIKPRPHSMPGTPPPQRASGPALGRLGRAWGWHGRARVPSLMPVVTLPEALKDPKCPCPYTRHHHDLATIRRGPDRILRRDLPAAMASLPNCLSALLRRAPRLVSRPSTLAAVAPLDVPNHRAPRLEGGGLSSAVVGNRPLSPTLLPSDALLPQCGPRTLPLQRMTSRAQAKLSGTAGPISATAHFAEVWCPMVWVATVPPNPRAQAFSRRLVRICNCASRRLASDSERIQRGRCSCFASRTSVSSKKKFRRP